MSNRLDILKASLEKKKERLDALLGNHFASVKETNGQPLNDKRDGWKTFKKWDKQNSSIQNAIDEIKKTEDAISTEEGLISYVEDVSESIPDEILSLVRDGILTQWRKYPSTFFVAGVDKARIQWDIKKKVLLVKFYRHVQDEEQRKNFCAVVNPLLKKFNPQK